jgi:large subunit ribosomal protein L11
MAKKVAGIIKLMIKAGQATAAPPVGPALGQRGANIAQFVKEFNARTAARSGDILPTVITVFVDKSFTFITKQPPLSALIKKAVGIESGSKTPGKEVIAKITNEQVMQIAKIKVEDMNCFGDLESAAQMVRGAARSMGIQAEVLESAAPAA